MQNKQNTKAKVIVIAIAILLCLALAVGITGAWYQAQRRATGTVKMDKGIVIDYTGFGKEADGIWIRENETTFRLFSDSDVQPGEKISPVDSGIKANASSVDFYARVKLSYEFYNGETKVNLANPSDLITTSATFFGSDWVDSGAGDGYYYYATGTALNKFTKAAPAGFVDLFDANAKFIIEGAGFTGAENEGEGGGFVVDETTSINKIVVYLTLETLQGDVSAEELNTMGWKIEPPIVNFEQISNAGQGAVVKATFNDAGEIIDETKYTAEELAKLGNMLITIDGTQTDFDKIIFPYNEETILEFDTRNVDYITLTYSNGMSDTFGLSEEDFANDYLSETKLKVKADYLKGKVTAYTIGVWSDSEYTGFSYSTTAMGNIYENNTSDTQFYDIENGLVLSNYFGNEKAITIKGYERVRERDFKLVYNGYNSYTEFIELFDSEENLGNIMSICYPCTISGYNSTVNNFDELCDWLIALDEATFIETYGYNLTITFQALLSSTILGTRYQVKVVNYRLFAENTGIESVKITDGVEIIEAEAFYRCKNLKTLTLPSSLKYIGREAFSLGSCSITDLTINGNNLVIGNEAFVNACQGDLTLNGVNIIGESAFAGCNCSQISFSNTITEIKAHAFAENWNLTEVNIPSSVKIIGNRAFSGMYLTNIYVNDGVTDIGNFAFDINSSAFSIRLPNTLLKIGERIFNEYYDTLPSNTTTNNGCIYVGNESNPYLFLLKVEDKALSTYTINSNTKFVYDKAFENCTNLTSITIPENVLGISSYVFNGCTSLTSVVLPDSLKTLGNEVFKDCTALETLNIPSSVTQMGQIGTYDYSSDYITEFTNCNSLQPSIIENGCAYLGDESNPYIVLWKVVDKTLTQYIINENTKFICDKAFESCINLISISIPNSVINIGAYAFKNCTSLNTVILSDNLTKLNVGVFTGCTELSNVTFPDSLDAICKYAFENCSKLTITFAELGGDWGSKNGNINDELISSTSSDGSYKLKPLSYTW